MARATAKSKAVAAGKRLAATRTTIPLPGGGSAQFFARHELPPRRSREMNVMGTMAEPLVKRAIAAGAVAEDGTVGDGSVLFTEDESRLLFELNDTAAWAYLRSWSLDEPIPDSPDGLLDLPTAVYDALIGHAAKLVADRDTSTDPGFTVDALPDDEDEDADPNLPT